MGIDISVCSKCRLGTVRLSDNVDGMTMLDVLDQLTSAAAWEPDFDALWDYRDVTELVVTSDQVDQMTARMSDVPAMSGKGRTALLVRSVTHETYANLLIRISKNPHRLQRTFRSRRRAMEWLEETNASLQQTEADACSCSPLLA